MQKKKTLIEKCILHDRYKRIFISMKNEIALQRVTDIFNKVFSKYRGQIENK